MKKWSEMFAENVGMKPMKKINVARYRAKEILKLKRAIWFLEQHLDCWNDTCDIEENAYDLTVLKKIVKEMEKENE